MLTKLKVRCERKAEVHSLLPLCCLCLGGHIQCAIILLGLTINH
ncbi:hypothetical protein OkiPb00424_52760 [Escherichia coli]